MLQSSAYRTNRWPRRSSSRSSSSSTRFESNGESGPPGPFPALLEQPAIEHSGGQVSPDHPENPPVRDPRCHRGHQPIVVDPVEEFGQVDINDEPITFNDEGLCLRHRLVSRAARPEAVAVLAECRVPPRLKPLQDRLLDHAIDHGGNAEVARPAGRLRDLHPTHRLRLVAPPGAVDLRSQTSAL